MIVRSAIDAAALVELLDEKPRVSLRSHVDLTRALREYGLLVLACRQDETDLREAIKRQDQHIRKIWLETLKVLMANARYRISNPEFATGVGAMCDTGIPRGFCDQTDLIVVAAAVAVRKGFDDLGFVHPPGEPEQVTIDSVSRCETLEAIRERRERGNYSAGVAREDVWKEVFAPLAATSSECTVLDRYLLKGLVERRSGLDHLRWILTRLEDSMPPGSRVRILAEVPDGSRTLREYEQLARQRGLRAASAKSDTIRVTLAPWRLTSDRGPHDRHMRFSCGSAIGVEEGFDRLRQSRIWGVDGLSWKHYIHPEALQALISRERYVLEHQQRLEFEL